MDRHLPIREVFRKDVGSRVKNPYRRQGKYLSGTRCPDCGLLFLNGTWKWSGAPAGQKLRSKKCPACLQIQDNYPGGMLHLGGTFLPRHRKEILKCVRNAEKATLAEHPLGRIFRTEEAQGEIVLSSTTEHLVSRIGKALRDAFGGELHIKYGPEVEWAIARWHKDE